jgi:ketosteroid isomerase-like protein
LLIAPNSCQDLHVKILILLAVPLALVLSALAADCPRNQPKTEAALVELERDWAAALSRKDADTVACMVADEFEDADVDGSLHTRSQTLEHIPQRKPGVNHLSEMRAHVEGNSGFTRGLATLVDASGKVAARVRFTDVFTYRDGRWQALAGHETLLGEATR